MASRHSSPSRPSQRTQENDTAYHRPQSRTHGRYCSSQNISYITEYSRGDSSSDHRVEGAPARGSSIRYHPYHSTRSRQSSSADSSGAASMYHSSPSTSRPLANQDISVRQSLHHWHPPSTPTPLPWYAESVARHEQGTRPSQIAHGRSFEAWFEDISTRQPGLTATSSVLPIKWLDMDTTLSGLLTHGQRYKHDPSNDHIDPTLPIHHIYHEVEKKAVALSIPLIDALKRGTDRGYRSLERLLQAAEEAASLRNSEPIRVAVVGDTGEGKSSLIGALIDDKKIIKDSRGGERCTRTIIEYQFWAGGPSMSKYRANAPIHARTADEVWSHILRFTNGLPVNRKTDAYDAWPFVELVSIGGPFAILKGNIILADTPGRDDINLLAQASVLNYLPRCSTVIIARKIDRISSASSPLRMIGAGSGRTMVVVATCSEVKDHSDIREDELLQTEEVRQLDAQLERYESELLCPTAPPEHRPLIQLKKRLLYFHKAQLFVDERNQRNSHNILTRTALPIDMFCVSVHDYERNVSGYAFDDPAPFPLPPKLSQIPALKQYIVSLCVPTQTKELVRHVAFILRNLIHSIEMRSHERTTAVEPTIEGGIGALRDSCLTSVHRCIDKTFKDRVEGQLLRTLETVLPVCISDARRLCRKWLKNSHPNTHRTYIENEKDYKLPRADNPSWNDRLLAPIQKNLGPIFEAMIDNLQNGFDHVEQEILSSMELLELDLRAQCPERITVEVDTFIQRITHKPIELRYMENVYTNDMKVFMREQKDRCCTNMFERSYFRDEMRKVYEKSYQTRPTQKQSVQLTEKESVQLAQMEVFEQLLCDTKPNPYDAVYSLLKDAIVSQKQHVKNFFGEQIGALFRTIDRDLEQLKEVRVGLTDEEARFMNDLLRSTVTAAKERAILEEKLKESGVDVEAIKAKLTERQSL